LSGFLITGSSWRERRAYYAGPTDASSDNAEAVTDYIDEETATKLAIVVPYHAVYGRAYLKTMRPYSLTDRTVIDNRVITSLDGEEEYYAVSLYRGEGEAKTLESFNEGIKAWADYMAGCVEKTGDNTYELEPVISTRGPYSYAAWFDPYESVGEFRDYYSCVVPASISQGFLSESSAGISPYLSLSEFAVRVIAEDTGVDRSEVEMLRSSPGHNFLLKV
jgi:hypothetical protein